MSEIGTTKTVRVLTTAEILAPTDAEESEMAAAHERFHETTGEWPARLGFPWASAAVVNRALDIVHAGVPASAGDDDLRRALVMAAQNALNCHRFADNPEERRFAEAWADFCAAGKTLAYLLTVGDQRFPVAPTDREEQVAATVIQWLGSPVGQGFLRDLGYEKKVK